MRTCLRVSPRTHRQPPTSNAGGKTGRTRSRTCYPRSTSARGYKPTSILSLTDAPFDREDPNLNPTAGACITCPRRSGFNTSLFCDVQGDQCLDSPCYHTKVNAHIDREIASRPALVLNVTKWRVAKQQRPGSLQEHQYWEIKDTDTNPDAEPSCPTTKTAIVVYGKRVGTTLTVCTDIHCPIHNPKIAARSAANETAATPNPAHAEREAEPYNDDHDQEQRREEEAEQERRAEERRQQREREFQRQREEHEAEEARLDAVRAARAATFERILENAPATLSATRLRVLLRALVNVDPHTFIDDLVGEIVGDNENEQRPAEEILLSAIDETADERLTRFALRLALTGHLGIPREGETDFIADAAAAFAPPPSAKTVRPKRPTPIKATLAANPKKKPAKKKAAA